MKDEISQNDKEIARGVRLWMAEKGITRKELAKRLGQPLSRVAQQIGGQKGWDRAIKEKYTVALSLMEGRKGKSAWELLEDYPGKMLDSILKKELPYLYKF